MYKDRKKDREMIKWKKDKGTKIEQIMNTIFNIRKY